MQTELRTNSRLAGRMGKRQPLEACRRILTETLEELEDRLSFSIAKGLQLPEIQGK